MDFMFDTQTQPGQHEQRACLCDRHAAFCVVHGEWHPATEDHEIVAAVAEAATRRPIARRIVRKRGGLTW